MELLGSDYLIDFVAAKSNEAFREKAYRVLVTEGIAILSKTVASRYGGKYLAKKYLDLIKIEEPEEEEKSNRSASEIIRSFKERLNGGVNESI